MDCTIKLQWNGKTVLEGKATKVAAFETVRAFFAGNFAGPDAVFMTGRDFSYADFARKLARSNFAQWQYADETGRAFADVASCD